LAACANECLFGLPIETEILRGLERLRVRPGRGQQQIDMQRTELGWGSVRTGIKKSASEGRVRIRATKANRLGILVEQGIRSEWPKTCTE